MDAYLFKQGSDPNVFITSKLTGKPQDMAMENTLIRTFPGAVETLRGPCHGSYLVVKTNEHGVVCNVGPEDASDVMNVVVQ
jgi:hypothetical protein